MKLNLVNEGVSGFRHYIGDQPLHGGDRIQVLIGGRWIEGFYHCPLNGPRCIASLICGDLMVAIPTDAEVRFP